MDWPDVSSLLGDEPSVQQQAASRAAALRGQRNFAAIAQLTGDPVLSQLGQSQLQDAHQQQQMAMAQQQHQLQLAEALPRMRMQQQQLAEAQRRQGQLADPTSPTSLLRLSLAKRFGMQVPEGAPGSAVDDKELDYSEKAYNAEENRRMRQLMQQQAGDARAQAREEANQRHQLQVSEKEEQFGARREDALGKQLDDKLNAFAARSGLKGYMDTQSKFKQLRGLVIDPATGHLKEQLDPRQMAELAIALQQAVSSGHSSQHEVEIINPKGLGSDAARLAEYFTGSPWDTGQRAIAEKMFHSAENANEVARGQVQQAFMENVPGVVGALRSLKRPTAAARAKAALMAHNINPDAIDDNGQLKPGASFMMPTVQEERSLPDGRVIQLLSDGTKRLKP